MCEISAVYEGGDFIAEVDYLLILDGSSGVGFDYFDVYGFSRIAPDKGVVTVGGGVAESAATVPLPEHTVEICMVAADELRRKQEGNGSHSGGVACQVGVIGDGIGGKTGLDDVVPDDKLEGNEVEGGDIDGSYEDEPVDDGDDCLGKEDQVGACDGGDGAAGAQYGVSVEDGMAQACEDGACEVQTEVADIAQLVVYIVAENEQEVHIAEDVHDASVEEGIGDELPDMRSDGGEHEHVRPCPEGFFGPDAGYLNNAGGIGEDEDDDVDDDKRIVGIGCASRLYACLYR